MLWQWQSPRGGRAHSRWLDPGRPSPTFQRMQIPASLRTLPNQLTLARIAAIPVICLLLVLGWDWLRWIALVLYVIAAVTDWFDGYLARRWNQTSAFGAFLDPVADKLMVAGALLVLVQLDRVNAIIAFIIIGREITISALREWMAEIGARKSVAVSSLGKIKTAAQMTAIPMLLFHDRLLDVIDTHYWGEYLLWIAGVLTVWSMLYYLRRAWPLIKEKAGTM